MLSLHHRIIQNYVAREEAGALIPSSMDCNKVRLWAGIGPLRPQTPLSLHMPSVGTHSR